MAGLREAAADVGREYPLKKGIEPRMIRVH